MNETDEEREMADRIYGAINTYSNYDSRGRQSREFKVGVSDLGYCSERLRRMLAQENPEDTDSLTAFLGTAIGDHAERAIKRHAYPSALVQPNVTLTLRSHTHTYTIPGHPDLVIPEGYLIDGKTSRGLAVPYRTGAADRQKKFQRHGYALASWERGLFDVPLDQVKVGNFWIDRGGDDKEILVNLEPFDPDVITEMTEWLEQVIYDYTNNQESVKEPAREICAATCGFFGNCRAFDTDVAGLLSDPVVLAAMEMYEDGKELVKEGERLKDQAKPALVGIDGFAKLNRTSGTRRFALRWLHINESEVRYTRKPYEKIDLRAVK